MKTPNDFSSLYNLQFNSKNPNDNIALLRLSLKIKDAKVVVDRVARCSGFRPPGEVRTGHEIPDSIIGHWIDICDKDGNVIYRRTIQKRLPLNMEHAGYRLQRIYALENYCILVPDLEEGHNLVLYEQSLRRPDDKKPRRVERLRLGLMQSENGRQCL